MIAISDIVECGYFDNDEKGGTIEVSVLVKGNYYKKIAPEILKLIDCLDHCVITDLEEIAQVSKRYFLIEEKNCFLNDAFLCMLRLITDANLIDKVDGISIRLGKVELVKYSEEFNIPVDIYYSSED